MTKVSANANKVKAKPSPSSAKAGGSTLTRSSRGKALTKKDGIYSFIGIGASNIPGGISTKKHSYCK